MATQFVLSFGGTGARIVEALTYLTAAGCRKDPLHVLMIDPDGANGNLDITVNQLRRYNTLNSLHDIPANLERTPLFSVPINKSNPESVSWQYPNSTQPFKTLIGYAGLPSDQQELVKLLYDEEDLDRDFRVGYVGRAHVGSADLYRTMRDALKRVESADDAADAGNADEAIDQFFGAIRRECQTGETRLFVVGSLFGGTGASGIPTVPALLSELLPNVRDDITVGGLLLGPYFSFPGEDETRPDSVLHPLATKAALSHYGTTDLGFDSVYFLGSPNRQKTNDANESGGSNQRNSPHYAELAAATAASHFFGADHQDVAGGQVFTSGSENVTWEETPGASDLNLGQRIVSLVAAMMFHCEFIHSDLQHTRHAGHRWAQKISGNEGESIQGQEPEFKDLHAFGRRFLDWARGIEETVPPSSSLINVATKVTSAALGALLSGEPQQLPKPYHVFFDRLNHQHAKQQNNAIARYLDVLGQASDRFIEKAYPSRGWTS